MKYERKPIIFNISTKGSGEFNIPEELITPETDQNSNGEGLRFWRSGLVGTRDESIELANSEKNKSTQ